MNPVRLPCTQTLPRVMQVDSILQIDPELRTGLQDRGKTKSGFRTDWRTVMDDIAGVFAR